MARIVVYAHRPKRPPPKQKAKKVSVAVEVPVIVAKKPREDRPQEKPSVAVSISRKRARLIAAARETERFGEPGEIADDAATTRAMASMPGRWG